MNLSAFSPGARSRGQEVEARAEFVAELGLGLGRDHLLLFLVREDLPARVAGRLGRNVVLGARGSGRAEQDGDHEHTRR